MSVFGVVVISLFAGQGLYPSASLPKLSHPGPNILTAIGDFLSHRYCCSRSCYANGSTCRRLKPRPIRSLVRWRGGRLKFLISYSHHSPVAKLNDENECGETCWSLMLSLSSWWLPFLPSKVAICLFVFLEQRGRHSDTCGVGWPRRYAFDVQHIRELRDVSSFMQIVVFYSFSRGESSISYLSPFASFTLPLLHSLQMLHGSFVCSLLVDFSLFITSVWCRRVAAPSASLRSLLLTTS